MLIITTDQVTYREAIRHNHSQMERVFVFVYKQWLFVKGESYSYENRHIAIAHTRHQLEAGEMCLLVVDDRDNYIICYQDSELELLTQESMPNLETIVEAIRNTSDLVRSHRYKLRVYPRSIVGTELVNWLCNYFNFSRQQAIEIGQSLIDYGWLHHTWNEHHFKDEPLLYRFYQDETITPPLIAQ